MVKTIVAREKIDCSHLLGQFLDESHYDVLVEEDTDCFQQADCDPIAKLNCTTGDCADCKQLNTRDERKVAFIFRKNFFSKAEQDAAYAGLREAATLTQNRGLAAGPKADKCGGREWTTDFQLHVIDLFKKEAENSVVKIDLKAEIERLRELYPGSESTRGLVWLSAKVKDDEFDFEK